MGSIHKYVTQVAERNQQRDSAKYDEKIKKAGKNRLGDKHHYSKWGSRPATCKPNELLTAFYYREILGN
ncbi:hypothetical protein [Providencia hangzhouensis]|uniref:hypothetical protein n=1 Tax=Providencia hangzhouensis TaxID=3031799 RepID=UPI0034DDA153